MTHLYLARMDVTCAFLPMFERWYDERHAPDLLKSGFHSCSAFYATEGTPLVHNVYLIPSPEIFKSPKYLGARDVKVDTLRPTVLENVSNRSNTPYRQVEVLRGTPLDVPKSAPAMALQFDLTCDSIELIGRVQSLFATSEEKVRVCQRDGSHINASVEPEWLVFVELPNEDSLKKLEILGDVGVTNWKIQILRHRVTFAA
jgi:hypothetical protein